MHTFQDIILRLNEFWSKKGCLIHQPYDLEKGAATFNPVTFLKVLGPEPYKAAYVDPCRRPQDGRYAQNPNRLQEFHQYQVILKPSPSDVLSLYVQSLGAIGFDLSKHDIRFVHDDWESPTLGAWGLGWEVWIDGMEVTQFTYFQSVAGFALKPVTAEIAYGLERLSMLLQNKTNVYDMQYSADYTYGEVYTQNEIEWSTYNFEKSDAKMWLEHFNHYEKEAKRLIECELAIPAYDFVIKASHAFNMLEARGVISTTERTGYIFRIRELARLAATGYIQSREKLGFPLLNKHSSAVYHAQPVQPFSKQLTSKTDFLFEIGVEQLPADYVKIGQDLLKKGLETLFKEERISFERIDYFATPQRLSALVYGLSPQTEAIHQVKKGPLASLAFDTHGHLTPQGAGFLKSFSSEKTITLHGIKAREFPSLTIEKVSDQEYLFVKLTEPSRETAHILQEKLPDLLKGMIFPKNMRWGSFDLTFARPIKWICALLGRDVLSFEYAGILSSSYSYGHAQYAPQMFEIKIPTEYESLLKEHYVLANLEERKNLILKQLDAIQKEHQAIALKKERVLNEVTNLVEWPVVACHHFDKHFLEAPKELLISEMVEHQRYFPLEDQNGQLLPLFVMTLDHSVNPVVLDNNNKVLSARLSDGVFLYTQDLKQPLEHFNTFLKTITFQKDLGSIADKVERLQHHAHLLMHTFKIGNTEKVTREVTLSKADLATHLVKEFPELQGIAGKIYALKGCEDAEVASALYEQWLPNSESGPLPLTTTGVILSLSDKLDNLLGYYSVGLRPTSSSDPYALRRQTLGIIKILIQHKLSCSLTRLFENGFHAFSKNSGSEIVKEIIEFFRNRIKTVFEDFGFKKDAIDAVISSHFDNPYDDYERLQALTALRSEPHFSYLIEVYKRLKGQVEKLSPLALHHNQLHLEEEKVLFDALVAVESLIAQKGHAYHEIFRELSKLHVPLKALFDNVKILDENLEIRNNRLGLLQKAYTIFMTFFDLSKIQNA